MALLITSPTSCYLPRYLPFLLFPPLLFSFLSYTDLGHTLYLSFSNSFISFPPHQLWHSHTFRHHPNSLPLCSMDACFNYSRCASMENFLIYAYDAPYHEPLWYFQALRSSDWVTTDASRACVFLIIEPESFSLLPLHPHPSTLPYWNGGLNHIIASLSDKWSLTSRLHHTLGNASMLALSLQETGYRPGFDVSIPLPGRIHLRHIQSLKPWSRKYFLTFKGARYLGHKWGNIRSHMTFREMHNDGDVIIAMTCNHVTNDKIRKQHPEEGNGCEEDEERYMRYDYKDLMNTTFGLAPAGRSPSSYRMIETLSTGAIPVLIADNYMRPFDNMIEWHRCLLQFPTAEMARILFALRTMSKEEMERRQRYCLFIYEEYLKDDATLARSVVRALKLRFNGMFPQFDEILPIMGGSS